MDSDVELKGVEGRWESVLQFLNSWDSDNDTIPLLVAIGAGTQDIDRNDSRRPLWNWLCSRREHVLAIMCSPEETLSRRSKFHDTLDSVNNTEFESSRVLLYEAACNSIVTSKVTDLGATEALKRALRIDETSTSSANSGGHESIPV